MRGSLVMTEPRIGGQHGLIRPHRVRLTVGDLAPAGHDDEAAADHGAELVSCDRRAAVIYEPYSVRTHFP